jgi:hypothetical protein
MHDHQYEKLRRVVVREERERILGIFEWYISVLGDSSSEKNTKQILEHIIKTIEHNLTV